MRELISPVPSALAQRDMNHRTVSALQPTQPETGAGRFAVIPSGDRPARSWIESRHGEAGMAGLGPEQEARYALDYGLRRENLLPGWRPLEWCK